VNISEIYDSFIDKETYERVYVGEYFYSIYANISMFRLFASLFIFLSAIYIYFVVLHLNKLKNNKILSVSLIITDILFVVCRVVVFVNPWY
jgi:hypothetical protein